MSLLPMDFSEESKPLSAGTYSARIVGAEVKTSKAGNAYINWQLELFGSSEVNGKRVYYMTMPSGPMVAKLAEFHKAATGEAIDKTAKQYDPEMLIGRELNITLVIGSYEGKERPEVKSVAKLS